jgi:hypothetical protein
MASMDPMDDYIGKRMQNLVGKARPPAPGKAQLLRNAAQVAYLRAYRPAEADSQIHHPLWRLLKTGANRKQRHLEPTKFFDWTIVYSFELSLVNLKLMF